MEIKTNAYAGVEVGHNDDVLIIQYTGRILCVYDMWNKNVKSKIRAEYSRQTESIHA
jgi:hypothetical protein